jgi:hypothetical protein
MQPCPAAFPGSLARNPSRQPFPAAFPGSLSESYKLNNRPNAGMQYCILFPAEGRHFIASFPAMTRHCDFEPCVLTFSVKAIFITTILALVNMWLTEQVIQM